MAEAPAHRPAFLLELGVVPYPSALKLQHAIHRLRAGGEIPDTIVLLEHRPVITVGRSADRRHLLVSEEELQQRGISVHKVERGGDITYHGPGQLVGYPILHLREGLVGVRRYVEQLEGSLVTALAGLGVTAHRRPRHVGVWVGDRKLASIGVAVRRGVTLHGFALNVTTDLACFGLMNPCGLADVKMTSLEKEGGETRPELVRAEVASRLSSSLGLAFQKNLPRSLTSLTKGLKAASIASASVRS